jgi:hypothetical protein
MAAYGSSTDLRHLEKHGRQYRAKLDVPRKLREIVGRAALKKSLGTDSLTEAQHLRWPALAELRKQLHEIARKAKSAPLDPISAEALEWHDHLDLLDRVAEHPISQSDAASFAETRALIEGHLEGKAEEIERDHGFRKSHEYLMWTSGSATLGTASRSAVPRPDMKFGSALREPTSRDARAAFPPCLPRRVNGGAKGSQGIGVIGTHWLVAADEARRPPRGGLRAFRIFAGGEVSEVERGAMAT